MGFLGQVFLPGQVTRDILYCGFSDQDGLLGHDGADRRIVSLYQVSSSISVLYSRNHLVFMTTTASK